MKIIPLIILISLSVVGFGYFLAKDGEEREPYSFVNFTISNLIQWGLIWWMLQ